MEPRQDNNLPSKGITPWLERLFTTEQFTYVQLRRMFFPLLLDQLFIFAIGILTMAMVASSGPAAGAAVGLAMAINQVVSLFFTTLCTGGAILVAQTYGRGDLSQVRKAAGQTLLITTCVALACAALLVTVSPGILALAYPRADVSVRDDAALYLRLVGLSYPAFAIFNAVFFTYRSIGDTKSSLLLTVFINLTHLLVSLLLINGLGLGVTGSGLSYIIARVLGAVLALVWMFRIHNRIALRPRQVAHFSGDLSRRVVTLSSPIMMEQLLIQAGLLLTQRFVTALSTDSISANVVANSAFNLFNAVAFSLTNLTMTVCGQCVGARRPDLTDHYRRSIIRAGRLLMLATSLLISPLFPLVVRLYAPTSAALPIIYRCLAIAAIALPLLWCDGNLTSAAMRAAGDAAYVTRVSLVTLWGVRIALGYLLCIPLGLGVPGLWIGLVLEWGARWVFLTPRIRTGRWLQKVRAT